MIRVILSDSCIRDFEFAAAKKEAVAVFILAREHDTDKAGMFEQICRYVARITPFLGSAIYFPRLVSVGLKNRAPCAFENGL